MLTRFCRDREGSIAITFAMMLIPMVGVTALAVDISRAYVVRSRLAHAIDAGGLAMASSSGTPAELKARLDAFLQANYPDTALGATTAVTTATEGYKTKITATASVDTTFARLIGYNTVDVSVSNEVVREVAGLEIALVLDNTGSMLTNNNIGALRDSAKLFVETLFNGRLSDDRLKIGIVPYSAAVNPASGGVAVSTPPSGVTHDPSNPTAWKGCVEERAYPHDVLDTWTSEGGPWKVYRWSRASDNDYRGSNMNNDPDDCNQQTGPNLGCPSPIIRLTSVRQTLVTEIGKLRAWCRGGTLGNVGMAWGWRLLSPERPYTEGLPYNTKGWRKIAIMMTDGDNQFYDYNSSDSFDSDYTAYGRLDDGVLGTTNRTTARNIVNTRFEEICTSMKRKNIEIYTIVFTSGITTATRDMYKRCATDEKKYYYAPSQDDLRKAFRAISYELSNVRLSQ